MFSDADLLGVPIRLVVSPRNMKDAVVELSSRDKSVQDKVALDAVVPTVKDLIAKMTKEIEQNNKKNEAGLRKSESGFFS